MNKNEKRVFLKEIKRSKEKLKEKIGKEGHN